MPANTDPIFTKNGKISGVAVSAANTSSQGGGTIGTDIFLACTADATNGSYVREVRFMPTASTANTATTATVARVFKSSATSGATTSSNTHLLYEITLASVTADSSTAAAPFYTVPLGIVLDAGHTILVTNHAAPAANTAWKAVVICGDY